MKEQHKIFFAQKPQNFTCTWAKHSTIISFWMLKCVTLLLLLLLQKKCEYHRTCCDYVVAATCQDDSVWNDRKKTTTFLSAGRKYGLRFVKKLCTYV